MSNYPHNPQGCECPNGCDHVWFCEMEDNPEQSRYLCMQCREYFDKVVIEAAQVTKALNKSI